jgi:hypothetical protein
MIARHPYYERQRIKHHLQGLEFLQHPARRWRGLRGLPGTAHLPPLFEARRRVFQTALQPPVADAQGLRLGKPRGKARRGSGSPLCHPSAGAGKAKRHPRTDLHQIAEQDPGPGQALPDDPPVEDEGHVERSPIHRSPGHNLCCDRLLALSPKHLVSPDRQCPSGRYPASSWPVWPIWKKSAYLQNR